MPYLKPEISFKTKRIQKMISKYGKMSGLMMAVIFFTKLEIRLSLKCYCDSSPAIVVERTWKS